MGFSLGLAFIVGALSYCSLPGPAAGLNLDDVNAFIGTGGPGYGVGSLFPGPQVPFGAMRLSPDTSYGQYSFLLPAPIPHNEIGFIPDGFIFGAYHCGGYYYNDTTIEAFSHTHMVGAGIPDLGNFGVMPVRAISSKTITNGNYRSAFSHEQETARVGR